MPSTRIYQRPFESRSMMPGAPPALSSTGSLGPALMIFTARTTPSMRHSTLTARAVKMQYDEPSGP